MEVSVVIVSYNVRDLLRACLASVGRETAISHEVIVVDNNSRDGSVEMVREEFPETVLLASLQNLGFAKASNQGLAVAQGAFVLFLNPDTVVLDHAVDRLLAEMRNNPEVAIGCPRVQNPDGTLQHSLHKEPGLSLQLYQYLCLDRLFPKSPRFGATNMTHLDYSSGSDVDWATGCALMMKTSVAKALGGFDERFFLYSEEVDLCRRARDSRGPVRFFPDARIVHHSEGCTNQRTGTHTAIWTETRKSLLRSRYLYLRKHHRISYVLVALAIDYAFYSAVFLRNAVLRTGKEAAQKRHFAAKCLQCLKGVLR